ncbi:MAG: EAL domain-containing protein [Lachnospiraceae bacterium]|nr:EAL domain-containing protein [Lachnospiraceae bacterium]
MDRKSRYSAGIKRKVIVVDDEYVNRQMLGFIISQKYDVMYAENGRDALEKIKTVKTELSLVLLDIMMPEMDGFELIKIMKDDEELRHIPIIVLTSEESAEVKSLKLGASDFIMKPYNRPEVILARIGRIVELNEGRHIIQDTERDTLTGLYNQNYFYEYAVQLDQYFPNWEMDAVVIDVDHFHLVNSLYGRQFGNEVLVKIADTIRSILSETMDGYACRYEADKFYLYCTHLDDYEVIRSQIMEELFTLGDDKRVRIRLGVYSDVERQLGMEERFDRAKLACNRIRNNYTQAIAYYDNKLHKDAIFAERLIHDIHDAIVNKNLVVYYQPKYGVQGEKPVLKSAEALIRWNHPEFGMISPGKFIPLFEDNGLIQILDHFVWEEAAKQIRKWKDEYGVTVPVSVNVSRMDIYDPRLETRLLDILKDNGLEPSEYMLEITESAYSDDSSQLIEVVQSLRDKGFKIEMDDFCSGYSSLNMLTMLPVDVLKMDMQFVRNVHTDENSFKLIKLVMEIAEFMNFTVIAEGVENKEQYDLLKQAGCDLIQGYYFSKPVPADEFVQFFDKD